MTPKAAAILFLDVHAAIVFRSYPYTSQTSCNQEKADTLHDPPFSWGCSWDTVLIRETSADIFSLPTTSV